MTMAEKSHAPLVVPKWATDMNSTLSSKSKPANLANPPGYLPSSGKVSNSYSTNERYRLVTLIRKDMHQNKKSPRALRIGIPTA